MRTLAILIGGAVALAACSTTPPPPPAPPDINNVLLAPGFLAHAVSANTYEIQAAQLALQASALARARGCVRVRVCVNEHRRAHDRAAQNFATLKISRDLL